MKNKFISAEIIETVKLIVKEHPDVIFCGSLGLVLNNQIERNVKDVDILVNDDFYQKGGFFNDLRQMVNDHHSHKFMVGKDTVTCFSLNFPTNIKVDVLYNETSPPVSTKMNFDGIEINVETPESAISVKTKYILNDKKPQSMLKHLSDLIEIGIDRKKLINLISDSFVMTGDLFYEEPTIECDDDDLPF